MGLKGGRGGPFPTPPLSLPSYRGQGRILAAQRLGSRAGTELCVDTQVSGEYKIGWVSPRDNQIYPQILLMLEMLI